MTAATPDGRLSLCLSGGGFRTTLFHLGMVRALRAATRDGLRAIDAVTEVYAVSGGSIILAAHMMRHWHAYTGRDTAFAAMEAEVVASPTATCATACCALR